MITLKGSRKTQRRQVEAGSVLQLQRIEQHLAGFQEKHETPAQAVKRLVEEVQLTRERDRAAQSEGETE